MSNPFGTESENAAAQSGAVSPMFAGLEDLQPSERSFGYEPLPEFGDYVFTVIKSEGRLFKNSGNSGLTFQLQIDEGPGNTPGQKTGYMNVAFFETKKTKADGTLRTEKEFHDAKVANAQAIFRLNVAAGLPKLTGPANTQDAEAVAAYGKLFAGRKLIGRIVVEIDKSTGKAGNRLILDSVEALDGPAWKRDGKKRVVDPTKNALQAAREAIEAENKKAQQKSGTAGARKEGGPF